MDTNERAVIDVTGLDALLKLLGRRGYRVVGPTVRDGAIVYDDVGSVAGLPRGWHDEQDAGRYRLVDRGDAALFGYAVGPESVRRFLNPPRQRLWSATRSEDTIRILPASAAQERFAFIGVRSCELHAIAIQDRVLLGGAHADSRYRARRDGAFFVAVNCGQAGGTCFCVSMATGPRAESGFDLALTELLDADRHEFLVDVGSESGRDVLEGLPQRAVTDADLSTAAAVVANTSAHMGRQMQSEDVPALLLANLDHPRWHEVAARCLACGNCTLVCPTCFCTTVEDGSDPAGDAFERTQRWDSCFTADFSFVHGGSVRASTRSRYRQWLTHKLATWVDQFGTSGCVGCGRCITWCPVGIDLTEEVSAIRDGGSAIAGAGTLP